MIAARWHHTSLTVRDVARSAAFFEAAFGYATTFEALGMTDPIARMTGRPGLACDLRQMAHPTSAHVLELVALRGYPDAEGEGAAPLGVGRAHVSMIVPALDAARAEMERLGARALGEETEFAEGRALYLREPGGAVIEIEELSGDA